MKNLHFLYEIFLLSAGVSTDSRQITPKSLFFALKGENFDGNDYAKRALELGAYAAVIDNPKVVEDSRYILVDNTLEALQQLARHHRRQFNIPVVALTGSNGKTTTKELLSTLLSVKYKTLSTSGNLNNHIGVPLTLLKIDKRTEAAVIEMGASAPGEIATLAKIAEPTIGVVTNIGKAHLEGFGSLKGVERGKGELYDYLQENNGTALYNADNSDIRKMVFSRPQLAAIPYGLSISKAEVYTPTASKPFITLSLPLINATIKTHLVGSYNVDNVLAALAVGIFLECDPYLSIYAIESYIPSNNRSQLEYSLNNSLIIDAYNANPTSMRVALENLSGIAGKKKGVILGDMLELGSYSLQEHLSILEYLQEMELDYIYIVGKEFIKASHMIPTIKERALFAKDSLEMLEILKRERPKEATLLIKGSRGIKLERVLEALQ